MAESKHHFVVVLVIVPPYNHTRADGPYDPCSICLKLMSNTELTNLVGDLKSQLREAKFELELANIRAADWKKAWYDQRGATGKAWWEGFRFDK